MYFGGKTSCVLAGNYFFVFWEGGRGNEIVRFSGKNKFSFWWKNDFFLFLGEKTSLCFSRKISFVFLTGNLIWFFGRKINFVFVRKISCVFLLEK